MTLLCCMQPFGRSKAFNPGQLAPDIDRQRGDHFQVSVVGSGPRALVIQAEPLVPQAKQLVYLRLEEGDDRTDPAKNSRSPRGHGCKPRQQFCNDRFAVKTLTGHPLIGNEELTRKPIRADRNADDMTKREGGSLLLPPHGAGPRADLPGLDEAVEVSVFRSRSVPAGVRMIEDENSGLAINEVALWIVGTLSEGFSVEQFHHWRPTILGKVFQHADKLVRSLLDPVTPRAIARIQALRIVGLLVDWGLTKCLGHVFRRLGRWHY